MYMAVPLLAGHMLNSCSSWGSSGAAAAAAGRGGLDLMPVYVPAYVFSWWHGGTKVRCVSTGAWY
jgi:hypothetical protein